MVRFSFIFLFWAFHASAEPAVVLTEANIAHRIRLDNPDLKAARWKIKEAWGQWQQSGRHARPSFDVQWSHDSQLREGEVKVGVSRSFPITDRLKWEKAISQSELAAAEMEVRHVEQQLIAESKSILIQVAAIKSRRHWISLDKKEAQKFVAQLVKNQQRAEASRLDVSQAKIDAASLLIEQKQLDAKEASLLADLKNLLGMPLAAQVTVHSVLPPLQSNAKGSSSQRADYQQAVWHVQSAQQQVRRELANRYDNLEAGVFLNGMRQEDVPTGYNKDLMLGFQLRIPLPFGDDNSGNIASAKAHAERRNLEAKAIMTKAEHRAQGALAEMKEWKKLDDQITHELLPLAEEQSQLAHQAYVQGQGDLAAMFRARSQKRQLLLSRVDARCSYHLARIRHESALGQP